MLSPAVIAVERAVTFNTFLNSLYEIYSEKRAVAEHDFSRSSTRLPRQREVMKMSAVEYKTNMRNRTNNYKVKE
jgi:hypothetical protein